MQFGVADAFQQTATRHGLDWNPGVDTSSTFDNLEIRNNGTTVTPPDAPANPSPSNTATSVATTAAMSWSATGATSYDVAFGTVNPPPPVSIAQSGTTLHPAADGDQHDLLLAGDSAKRGRINGRTRLDVHHWRAATTATASTSTRHAGHTESVECRNRCGHDSCTDLECAGCDQL